MARDVKEWIENETKEDTLKLGMSLKAENYKLPMIKLTYGDQVLPVPQVEATDIMTQYWSFALKDNVVSCNCNELYDRGVNTCDSSISKEDKYKAMGELLREIGPYEVLRNTLDMSFDWETEYYMGNTRSFLYNVEAPFTGTIGEDQEWKVESVKSNEVE